MKYFRLFCFVLVTLTIVTAAALAARNENYVLDKTFKLRNKQFLFSGVGQEDKSIRKMLFDNAGGVIIVGSFTRFNGKQHSRILRLTSGLTVDPAFAPIVNGEIVDAALTIEGNILIGGSFTSVNGVSRNGVARLLSNGALDAGFDPGTGANGILNNVSQVIPFSDGTLAIFGTFSKVNEYSTEYSIAKLKSDGSVDTTFLINLALTSLNDGTRRISADVCQGIAGDKLLVVGFGEDQNSNSPDGFQGSTVINSDGTRTEPIKVANQLLGSYQHERGSMSINGSAFGLISHEVFNNTFTPLHESLYRFDATGQLDTGFLIKKKTYFNSVQVQSDGKILVAPQTIAIRKKGNKTSYSTKAVIERYTSAGSLEKTLQLPKIKNKAIEFRNTLTLADGTIIIHVREVNASKSVGTGRTFKHYLMKVKPRR